MYEYTITYRRQNLNYDFFVFQTVDKQLLYHHAKHWTEILNAPGHISTSYVMSEDKLTLKVIVLWENEAYATEFSSPTRKQFIAAMESYNQKTGTTSTVSISTLPDTANLKAKKFSTRITVEEAGKELQDFITRIKETT